MTDFANIRQAPNTQMKTESIRKPCSLHGKRAVMFRSHQRRLIFRLVLFCLVGILLQQSANAQSTRCDHPETAIIARRVAQIFILKYGRPAQADQRRFSYVAYDLNRDHKMEYFVVLLDIGGTGGRTSFLLGHDLDMISEFSLVKFPVYISKHIYHDGWPDLYINHWGGWHVGHYADGYGVNPSVWCMEDSVQAQHLKVLFQDPWAEVCTF